MKSIAFTVILLPFLVCASLAHMVQEKTYRASTATKIQTDYAISSLGYVIVGKCLKNSRIPEKDTKTNCQVTLIRP